MNIPAPSDGDGDIRRPSTSPTASPTQNTARTNSENHTRVRLPGIRLSSGCRGTGQDGF